ncbi:MAG: PilZ domain-containing protein [Candidatus Eremiobacteraeota bacterium]|nr:PilZ domain-containing protein [Candidatus Eremiobacteraeota bacterium]
MWSKKAEKTAADRQSERHDISLRVRSRDLPGYRAITLDVSRTGLQIETEELLPTGLVLPLDLEFDHDQLADFSCPARVMWARPDGSDRRSRFRAGLSFEPADDAQRRSLALMATILQTRSEADLDDLLEEAKRLDPERSDTFQRVVGRKPSRMTRPMQHIGVLIPLNVTLTGYQWAQGCLELRFVEGQNPYSLYFPDCQWVTDAAVATGVKVVGMFATYGSEALRKIESRGDKRWRHYRFVAEGHQPVFEVLSLPCRPHPTHA